MVATSWWIGSQAIRVRGFLWRPSVWRTIGDPGVPKHAFNSKYWSFSPRFGVSWQPGSMQHTFIRAAVGLFHGPLAHRLFQNLVAGPFNPQISETADDPNNASTGYISLTDPYANFPGGNAFPSQDSFACYTCVGSASTPFVIPSSVVAMFDPNLKQPTTLSWNTSIERHFRSEIMIRAAYVGSHSYDQPLVRDLNYATNNVRPNPLYAAIDPTMSIVYSDYHSLQFTFDKKFTSNLQLESNFTWQIINKDVDSIGNTFAARLNDPRSIAANYANSDQYLPYTLVTNFIYMLPIPGSWAANKFVKTTLGGWEASGIWTWQSGIPFTVYWSGNRSGTLNGYDRADLTSTPAVYNNGNTNRQFINESAFMANAVGTYGTSKRNAYGMPDIDNIDFGFYKNFPFGEQRNLQIRFAAFNLFNHATLGLIAYDCYRC